MKSKLSWRGADWFALVLAFLIAAVLFATDVSAQTRTIFNPSSDYVETSDSWSHRAARNALAAGDPREARRIWLALAESYLSRNRLQEAAWTFRQADEPSRADEIIRQLEKILATATIVKVESIGRGVTVSKKITFDNGMSAIFKTIDFQTEIGAYRLDRLLGFDMTPVTVRREINGVVGSLQLWIEDTVFPPKVTYGREVYSSSATSSDLFAFDFLLGNTDRHNENFLIRAGNYFVTIDHGRTFGWGGQDFAERIMPSTPIPRRQVFERLLMIEDGQFDLHAVFGDVLSHQQIAFVQRKAGMLASYVRERIAALGEDVVFAGLDPFIDISLQNLRTDFERFVETRQWRQLSSLVGQASTHTAVPLLKMLVEMLPRSSQSLTSALGFSLFTKDKVTAEQARRFVSQVFRQEPSGADIGAVEAQAKMWLRRGPAGVFEFFANLPWMQERLQKESSWLEAALEGAVARGSLEAQWHLIKPFATSLAQKVPQTALRIAQLLPSGSAIYRDWAQSMLANPSTSRMLWTLDSPEVHKLLLSQGFGSEAGFDFDSLVAYLEQNRTKISAATLSEFLRSAPAVIDTPLRLATLIDLFPGPEYRDAFNLRVRNTLSGDAKIYVLRALFQSQRKVFDQLTGVSAQAKVQDLAPQSLREVSFSVVESGVASVTVSRLAPLGKLGVRLFGQSARGGVVSDIHVTNANEQRLLLRVLSAARVVGLNPSRAGANGWALPRSVLLGELEFELADGSKIGWQGVMAELSRARTWKEMLKTERGLEEARMNALEMRFRGVSQPSLVPIRQVISCQIIFGN